GGLCSLVGRSWRTGSKRRVTRGSRPNWASRNSSSSARRKPTRSPTRRSSRTPSLTRSPDHERSYRSARFAVPTETRERAVYRAPRRRRGDPTETDRATAHRVVAHDPGAAAFDVEPVLLVEVDNAVADVRRETYRRFDIRNVVVQHDR